MLTDIRIVWLAVAILLPAAAMGGSSGSPTGGPATGGAATTGAATGEFKPDPTALMKDLQMESNADHRMTLVLWLPTEFWRAALDSTGKASSEQVEQFTREIDPYVVVAVADGQIGFMGSMNFSEPELLKNSVTIENARGEVLSPLPDDAISGGVRNMTQMMRPMFGNMLGALGLHIAFIVFPGTEKGGGRTVEPTKEGAFIVHVGTVAVRYRLPLASLLPPVMDEKTGETFPGSYHFNPYTGNKLSPAPIRTNLPVHSPAAPGGSSSAPAAPAEQPAKPSVQQRPGAPG